VVTEFEAEGGKEYVIIPATFHPNLQGQFTLNVFSRSTDSISLSLLHHTVDHILFVRWLLFYLLFSGPEGVCHLLWKNQGSWGEGTSGGCMNHPTFIQNPHYSLSVDK